MQFLYPSFLWALLALAIPIIIHLFYFRRFKKVMFTNVKFLKEIKEETSSRNKLKNLLILLMRCLAVAALVFAFAQPFISDKTDIKKGSKAISIFIDNSFSMRSQQNEVGLLDIALEKARQIVSAYSEDDKFQILTHDFEGRHQRLVSKDDANSLIDEIEISPSVKPLSKVINRQLQALGTDQDYKISYILSDFQKSITKELAIADTSLEVNLLPIQAVSEQNASIDSAWFEAPVPMINQRNRLIVRVTNHAAEELENVRLSILRDGQEKPVGTLNIPGNSSATDTVDISVLRHGWHTAELKIIDFPVQFDDSYFIAFNVSESVKVLSINESGSNRYLDAVFKGLNYYNLTNQSVRQINYASFVDFDFIILNDLNTLSSGLASEIAQYVQNGGRVLAFPGAAIDRSNYNGFLSSIAANEFQAWEKKDRKVSGLNTEEFIFSNVFETVRSNIKLPETSGNYNLTRYQNRAQEVLLTYRDGNPYLVKYPRGKGIIYMCTSPLNTEFNDIATNAEIFVPMLYKMAIANEQSLKLAQIIGRDEVIETDNKRNSGELIYKITGNGEFIPGQTTVGNKVLLSINDQIDLSGIYDLNLNDELVSRLAFNYDRTESDLRFYNVGDLKQMFGSDLVSVIDQTDTADFTQLISEKDRGKVLWKWFLIAALLFLGLETLLLRIWKN